MLSAETVRDLLPLLIVLPLATAMLLPFIGLSAKAARQAALAAALVQLALTAAIVVSAYGPLNKRESAREFATLAERGQVFLPEFVPGDAGVDRKIMNGQIVRMPTHNTSWEIAPLSSGDPKIQGIKFFIGLDGLNLWLIALAAIMFVPVVLISGDGIKEGAGSYFAWLFALQAGVMGVFLAFDIVLFYVFFELTLVPLFFLISAWGSGPNRREAARKLFLFTLAGGLLTLVGIVAVVMTVYQTSDELTFSIPRLTELIQQQLHVDSQQNRDFWKERQVFIFLTLAAGFAVKIPLVPLHSWLPGAYSEAPIGVTVMLSAVLAKMGTFGLLRICMPMAPDAVLSVGLPILGTLAAIGIAYGAFCAFGQKSFKQLVAYSSVSHLGFCVLALMAFNAEGMAGGLLHMVNHGLSTGAMFLLVGLLLERYSSGQIADYSGLWKKLPVYTFFMLVICLASIGMPGLNNFVSEMLMLSSLFDLRNPRSTSMALAVVAAFGILLSAWYTLTMVQRVFFNDLREPAPVQPGEVKDMSARDWGIIAPLAALCLFLGILPQVALNPMKRDINALAWVADDARSGHVLPPPPVPTPVKKAEPKQPEKLPVMPRVK